MPNMRVERVKGMTIDMALGKDRYTLKGPAVSLF